MHIAASLTILLSKNVAGNWGKTWYTVSEQYISGLVTVLVPSLLNFDRKNILEMSTSAIGIGRELM